MKSETYILHNDQAKKYVCERVQQLDDKVEVVFRNATKKTLKQLGAVFGVWVKHIAIKGESEVAVHARLKAQFLARIYTIDPVGYEQENWTDTIAMCQELGDMDRMQKAAVRISLSWCTLEQMKQYMTAIENHYIDEGDPLPILDEYYGLRNWRK